MAKMISNRLLLTSIVILVIYWVTASFTPNPYLAISNNVLLFTASGFGLWRYRKKTLDILFREERLNETDGAGYGSYLAIYGIFLVFMGSFYGAIYSSVWIYAGEPQNWIGTSYAQFGRFLTVCGFVCMASSPDVTRDGFVLPERLWAVVAILILLFCAGFYLGNRMESVGTAKASCPDGWIMGTSKKTYHTSESPYRYLVSPRWCFATEEEAVKAGYRKWKK